MPKFIKSLVDTIELLNRKGLAPTYSPDQIVQEVHNKSMNIWRKYLDEYEHTQKISLYMRPFQNNDTVVLTTGAGTITSASDKYITAVLTTDNKVVNMVDIAHWANAINDSVRVPSADDPIGTVVASGGLLVRPTTLASVVVHYLVKPTKPVYAFTPSGTDYIYDDASSVDIQWSEILHDDIANRVLGALGIAQREGEAIQYSNMEQSKEGR